MTAHKPPTGGSQTYAQRGIYAGNTVTIGNNSELPVTWDSLGSGEDLLDRSTPDAPTVLASGIYAVTAVIQTLDTFTANGGFQAALHLDYLGDDNVNELTTRALLVDGRVIVTLTSTYYVPEGGVISATVRNLDGAAARDFNLREAAIQLVPGGP